MSDKPNDPMLSAAGKGLDESFAAFQFENQGSSGGQNENNEAENAIKGQAVELGAAAMGVPLPPGSGEEIAKRFSR